jgi:hypothetical protein
MMQKMLKTIFVNTLNSKRTTLSLCGINELRPPSPPVITSPMLTLTPTSRAPTARTLAEVLAAVRAADLPLRRRQEMIAALNTTARVLGRDLAQIPANPPLLRRRLAEANPLAHNLTQARWANVRSLLRAALSLIQPVSASRATTPLLPAWQALQARLDHAAIDRRRQAELLRLMRFCSDRQVLPEAVDDAVFAAFQAFLDNGLRKTAEDTFVTVCRFWNRLAATLPGWPAFQVATISRRQVWTLPWSAFPASLQAEVQAWLDRIAGTDPLGELPIRPARPATLRWHKSGLRIAASALVRRGREPASLTGLADLVELAAFKEICRYLLSRRGEGGASSYVAMVAALLRAVARHWVGAPPAPLRPWPPS